MWSKSAGFFKMPVFPEDEQKTHRAEILYWGSVLLFIFPLILISFNLLFGTNAENSINWVLGLIALLQILIRWMLWRGFVNESALILLTVGWVAMTEISRHVAGVRDVAIIGYVLILLASGYLLGWRATILFTVTSIAAIWRLAYLETTGFIVPSLGKPERIALDLTAIFILVFLVIYFIINTLTKSLEKAQRELAERLRTEQTLESEQERLHLALDASRMGTWDWDIEMGTILWSDKIEAMFGLDSGKFNGRYETYLTFIHPEDRSKVESAIQHSLVNEAPDYFVEHRLLLPNGVVRWLEGRGRVYRDGTGRPTRMAGTVVDITERKQAEAEREKLIQKLEATNAETEALRKGLTTIVGTLEFSEVLQQILDQVKRVVPYDSASIWKVEGNRQIFVGGRGLLPEFTSNVSFLSDEMNAAYPILAGKVPFILEGDVQAMIPDFREPLHNYINSWLALPLKVKGRIIGLLALDGRQKNQFSMRHVELALSYADQFAIALENSLLFTDLQQQLALRKNLIAELESKNAELERFTYTVSHDLKSPLVTINGFLGYLEKDASSGNMERLHKDVQRIREAVDKMRRMLGELLELSRIGRMVNASEMIPFADLAKDALDIVHGQLEERGVTVIVQPDLPAVFGDRQRLTEVLQNLIDNASKFMGDQKKPQIEIGQRGEEEGKTILFVRDNGIGIAPNYHEQVFGLFNKLNTDVEGTGIGLALVKRIIEFHGGRIWVESEMGKGATFYFTLPRR